MELDCGPKKKVSSVESKKKSNDRHNDEKEFVEELEFSA